MVSTRFDEIIKALRMMGRSLMSCTLLIKLKQSISGISMSAMTRSKQCARSCRMDNAIVGSSVVVTVKIARKKNLHKF